MSLKGFKIKILRQHWISNDETFNKGDLCSHGVLFLKIWEEILSDSKSGSWSLTATGLYLLRSLKVDYNVGDFENYLVPCCGHCIIPDENKNYVTILGCNSWVDWNIKHEDGNVKFTSKQWTIGVIDFEQYKKMVLEFTDAIEAFYGDPKEKDVPNNEFDKNWFQQFRAEWNELKKEHFS